MTAEMARMARGNRLGALAYLLELARMEAIEHTRTSSEERSKRIA